MEVEIGSVNFMGWEGKCETIMKVSWQNQETAPVGD